LKTLAIPEVPIKGVEQTGLPETDISELFEKTEDTMHKLGSLGSNLEQFGPKLAQLWQKLLPKFVL
jgi:hypothetical protein